MSRRGCTPSAAGNLKPEDITTRCCARISTPATHHSPDDGIPDLLLVRFGQQRPVRSHPVPPVGSVRARIDAADAPRLSAGAWRLGARGPPHGGPAQDQSRRLNMSTLCGMWSVQITSVAASSSGRSGSQAAAGRHGDLRRAVSVRQRTGISGARAPPPRRNRSAAGIRRSRRHDGTGVGSLYPDAVRRRGPVRARDAASSVRAPRTRHARRRRGVHNAVLLAGALLRRRPLAPAKPARPWISAVRSRRPTSPKRSPREWSCSRTEPLCRRAADARVIS